MIGCRENRVKARNAPCVNEPIRSWSHSCAVWGWWMGDRQDHLDRQGSQQTQRYRQVRKHHGEVMPLHVTCWG